MKNFTKQIVFRMIFSLVFIQIASQVNFAQAPNNQETNAQTVNSEKIIIKVSGIKSEDVLLKYKTFLSGIKGVLILGHTLKNEYILIDIDNSVKQVIDVLQALKDDGFYFEYLFNNPTKQKLNELFSNDPMIPNN